MGITKNHIHTENQVALAKLFKALGHPARIAIVDNLLLRKNLNCKDLGQFIQLAQSTISKHLKELHDVGILNVIVIGSNAYYNVNRIALEEITDYVDEIYQNLDTSEREKLFNYAQPFLRMCRPYLKLSNTV